MTFGQADDLVYEFATYTVTPGRPAQRKEEVYIETSECSLRVGLWQGFPDGSAVPGYTEVDPLLHAGALNRAPTSVTQTAVDCVERECMGRARLYSGYDLSGSGWFGG